MFSGRERRDHRWQSRGRMRITCALGLDVSDVALRLGRGHGGRPPSFRFLQARLEPVSRANRQSQDKTGTLRRVVQLTASRLGLRFVVVSDRYH